MVKTGFSPLTIVAVVEDYGMPFGPRSLSMSGPRCWSGLHQHFFLSLSVSLCKVSCAGPHKLSPFLFLLLPQAVAFCVFAREWICFVVGSTTATTTTTTKEGSAVYFNGIAPLSTCSISLFLFLSFSSSKLNFTILGRPDVEVFDRLDVDAEGKRGGGRRSRFC